MHKIVFAIFDKLKKKTVSRFDIKSVLSVALTLIEILPINSAEIVQSESQFLLCICYCALKEYSLQ